MGHLFAYSTMITHQQPICSHKTTVGIKLKDLEEIEKQSLQAPEEAALGGTVKAKKVNMKFDDEL